MIHSLNTSISGLTAAVKRASAAASNIANAGSTLSIDPVLQISGADADGQSDAYSGYRPVRIQQKTVVGGGTEAVARPVEPPFAPVVDPGHPDADADGVVKLPNVSLVEELVELKRAHHAYKANLAVIRTVDDLLGTLVDRKA